MKIYQSKCGLVSCYTVLSVHVFKKRFSKILACECSLIDSERGAVSAESQDNSC